MVITYKVCTFWFEKVSFRNFYIFAIIHSNMLIFPTLRFLEVIPVGEQERHQLHTLNPSQLQSGANEPITDLLNNQQLPTYDSITNTTQIPSRTNNTTTQALVNDPAKTSSPTTQPSAQVVSSPVTNVIQPNSPSSKETDPQEAYKKDKFSKPRVGGIASLADPSITSPTNSTIIPMTPR